MKTFVLLSLLCVVAACSSDGGEQSGTPAEQAEQAMRSGNNAGARDIVTAWIKNDPRNGKAYLQRAKVYLALNDGVAAEAEISRAQSLGIRKEDSRHLRAHALLLQNQLNDALAELEAGPVSAPYQGYAARMRGRILLALEDTAGAAAAYDAALRLDHKNADLWVDVAHFRWTTGEFKGAAKAADIAVKLAPRNVDALILHGQLARTQYGLKSALPWFEKALAIDSRNLAALNEKAGTLGDLGQAKEMLKITRQILTIDPSNANAFFLQAVLAARARNFDLARRLLERTKSKLDDRPATMLLQGVVEYELGNTNMAINRLSRLIAVQPDNLRARRLLGAALWRDGDIEGTIDVLEPLAVLTQADGYSLTLIGRAYERLGDRETAANYLDRAAYPIPQGDQDPLPEDALTVLRQKARSNPVAGPRIALIRGLLGSQLFEEARAEATSLREANPDVPAANIILGDTLSAMGRNGEAIPYYEKAAALNFTEPVALRLVAAKRRIGDRAGAKTVLDRFLSQNPRNVAGQIMMAEGLMAEGQFQPAATMLEALQKRLGDNDPMMLNNLAWCYFHLDRAKDALSLAQKAYAMASGNPVISDNYGWLLFQMDGNIDRATSLVEQATERSPAFLDAWWHLAQIYAENGNKPKAREIAERLGADNEYPLAGEARIFAQKLAQ